MLEHAGGEKHKNITKAAPYQLKRGEVGFIEKSWPSAKRWRRGVFVNRRWRSLHRGFGVF